MKDFLYKLWSIFLTWFSKLKIFSSGHIIPIIAYDPSDPKVTGDDVIQIMGIIQPGDVLIRGFDKYLDGKFIPDPKGYSHAGIYIGNNHIIHACSPEVQTINVIDFCQCDRIMVLHPSMEKTSDGVKIAQDLIGTPYDFNYESDNHMLYCFELIAKCYPEAHMEEFEVKQLGGLIKRSCYIAKSIYLNPFFKTIYERNDLG